MSGRDIIKDVMQKRGIGPKDFFGSTRLSHIVKARRIAIQRMVKAGMTQAMIARAMKRNYATVQYWMNPDYRARRKVYYANYWDQRRQELAA